MAQHIVRRISASGEVIYSRWVELTLDGPVFFQSVLDGPAVPDFCCVVNQAYRETGESGSGCLLLQWMAPLLAPPNFSTNPASSTAKTSTARSPPVHKVLCLRRNSLGYAVVSLSPSLFPRYPATEEASAAF